MELQDIMKLTLSNFFYTKDGKQKIKSIVQKEDKYFVNGLPVDDILFFDISWLSGKEFELYGFEKIKDGLWKKGNIILKHFSFDHWHVQKNEDDFGERFYTANALEKIVKEKFDIELCVGG